MKIFSLHAISLVLSLASTTLFASSGTDQLSLEDVRNITGVRISAVFSHTPFKTLDHEQFREACLQWYRPSVDELSSTQHLGFQEKHLGSALRFRKFITRENARLFQKILGDVTWQESQNLIPAALGLSPEVLEEAALIPAYKDRLAFLQNAPREDAWVYGMLGGDPRIDRLVLTTQIASRIKQTPAYVSAFFIRNLMEGDNTARMRLTGFLLHVENIFVLKQRVKTLGYKRKSDVVRTLEQKKLFPPVGVFLQEENTSIYGGYTMYCPEPQAGDSMPVWTYTPSPYLAPLM